MAVLELTNITKKFGDFTAVKNMNLTVADGEMVALLGGSGCGKTTTLRMIAGFTEPYAGEVKIDGRVMNKIPPYKRNVSIFFQNYALFPHMTVFENVAFGLKLQKLPKDEIRSRVEKILTMVKLTGLDKRYPRELSGGQQQRVALTRALVTRPSILLLDEPLSNLDAKLRVEMQVEIKRIQKETGLTTIIVTHDQEEAVSLADRVIVMNEGEILQVGGPKEVFDYPATPFIADFMGFSTFLHGTVEEKGADGGRIVCSGVSLAVEPAELKTLEKGDACIAAIRAENMEVAEGFGENVVGGHIKSLTYKGQRTRLEVEGCFAEDIYPAIHDYEKTGEDGQILIRLLKEKIRVYKA